MNTDSFSFNDQSSLTAEALPRELGYPASAEMFVNSLLNELSAFLGIPHRGICTLLNEKGCDYRVFNNIRD